MHQTTRDPAVWDEPEKFLPSRFLGADGEARASLFLPFQSGRRRWVGEVKVTIMVLHQKFVGEFKVTILVLHQNSVGEVKVTMLVLHQKCVGEFSHNNGFTSKVCGGA